MKVTDFFPDIAPAGGTIIVVLNDYYRQRAEERARLSGTKAALLQNQTGYRGQGGQQFLNDPDRRQQENVRGHYGENAARLLVWMPPGAKLDTWGQIDLPELKLDCKTVREDTWGLSVPLTQLWETVEHGEKEPMSVATMRSREVIIVKRYLLMAEQEHGVSYRMVGLAPPRQLLDHGLEKCWRPGGECLHLHQIDLEPFTLEVLKSLRGRRLPQPEEGRA